MKIERFSRGALSTILLIVAVTCPARAPAQFVVRLPERVNFGESHISSLVFGRWGKSDDARIVAENMLKRHIDFVADVVPLTDDQHAKLELAGQGDIDRFFDDIEIALRAAPRDLIPVEQLSQIQQSVLPLVRYQFGLHGGNSLFRKTLLSVLTAEEYRALRDVERKQYREVVQSTLLKAETLLRLDERQREAIVNLVVDKTEPLPYSAILDERDDAGFRRNLVLNQMGQLDGDLRDLLGDDAWPRWQQTFNAVRKNLAMRGIDVQ